MKQNMSIFRALKSKLFVKFSLSLNFCVGSEIIYNCFIQVLLYTLPFSHKMNSNFKAKSVAYLFVKLVLEIVVVGKRELTSFTLHE